MSGENSSNEQTVEKSNLKQYIDNFFDLITLYDDNLVFTNAEGIKYSHKYKEILKAAIDVFLQHESTYTANAVYEMFLMIYQITPEDKNKVDENSQESLISEPNTLLDLVNIMKKYEENTGELIDRQRDHFIHSVNVFILGLAIYAQNKNYRDKFKKYITENEFYKKYYKIDGEFSHEEFLYRWGIAALFHDIGYPFEIIGKQINKVIDDGVKSISVNYDVDAHIDFRDFNEFNSIVKIHPYNYADKFRGRYDETRVLDLFKPTDIMAHKICLDFKLGKNKFKKLLKHLNSFVKYMNDNNFVDHGYFSAILVMNSYGKLIQKYSKKNKDFFFYPIVDSATAILLHNYYNKTLQKKPFSLGRLKPDDSPISYLLILCDELQEWNRRPYGVLDKKKNHVNDFDVEITEEDMKVRYILKNGSMGLGFEEKKDEFIYSVLDVNSIFPAKLAILPDIKLDKIKRDITISEIKAPDVLLRNIEKLAIKINEQYNITTRKKLEEARKNNDVEKIKEYEEKCEYLCHFDDLRSDYKMSNIRQAKSIPKKLAMIGCEIAHIDETEMVEVTQFTANDVEDLAIFEHDDWRKEREGVGWVYGPEKDPDRLTSPYLVDWEDLDDEEIKDFDKDAVRNIPKLLNSIGLKVVRSRLRALTFKMNQLYETGTLDDTTTGEEQFYKLEPHIQFSNLKQADHLVKILNESGYDLVAKKDFGEPVYEFTSEEVEYFAKREHEGWYKLKLNLNETDSKNFVPWKELDEEVKKKNRQTFDMLAMMCDDKNVGLKIVRNE
ncbi:MAG: hypothetical protein IJL02_06615 [Methanobrevibacter sp.]|uniref:RyR domain-containing protein n=1 Tax=Methanobrevibacter sp. TaxID=66852 RepID=UPI0025DB5E26|nr:RyR domain-containing protein [Methanobrevibacter sp.]MBQ6099518.1 hypothetical protein [Methanobrevibacter sp.]